MRNRIRTACRPNWITVVIAVLLAASCASRTPPAVAGAPRYPDFVYPRVPTDLERVAGADRVERGWQFLQADNLRSAEREFTAAAKQTPALYPAQTGGAYVELAHRNYDRARTGFDVVLMRAPKYAPALVGRGQALLGLKRDDEAIIAFEAALAADLSLADLRPRIEALRFGTVQTLIARGRAAAGQNRLDEARDAYQRALAASPDSGFLYRELGTIERRQGNGSAALEHFRRATTLDRNDAVSFEQTGELLEEMMDFVAAEAAYRAANALEPTPALAARLATVLTRVRDARLPAQYRALPSATEITRGDLAALIAIRMEDRLGGPQRPQEVMTDLRGHWAAIWATQVVQAGMMDAFENHTFQPGARLRRVDLAVTVSRLLTRIAATQPALRARLAQRPMIADVATTHLNYSQIATAVSSGVLPLLPGNRFDVGRVVSGAEAIDAIDQIRMLAGASR